MAEPMSAERLEYLRARGGAIYGDELRELCAELDRARSEEERLTRRLESAIPWSTDALAVDDAQLRALRLRWSTGPELYQADADALIATVLEQRRQIERMRAELESVLAHCAPPVHATASVAAATVRRERDEARAGLRSVLDAISDLPGESSERLTASEAIAYVRQLYADRRAAEAEAEALRREPGSPVPTAVCSACGAKTWLRSEVGTVCGMPCPDGARCGGRMSR